MTVSGGPPHGMTVLQWGRDLKIAEIGLSPPVASQDRLLQWGRDLKIAEMDVIRNAACNPACFNGAAI